jgi:hypothetical protein
MFVECTQIRDLWVFQIFFSALYWYPQRLLSVIFSIQRSVLRLATNRTSERVLCFKMYSYIFAN